MSLFTAVFWAVLYANLHPTITAEAAEIGQAVRDNLSGTAPCLTYDDQDKTFSLTCDFDWTDNCVAADYILLKANEVFNGNGHSVHITGISNWEGLFRIASSNESPSSLDDAPVIYDVHVIVGETSSQGGFIIEAEQKHFIVRNCSSSGVINGVGGPSLRSGGGICGYRCTGDILITHCWSSGEIRGPDSGGTAGRQLGFHDGDRTVTISHCYSTGDIAGGKSGGICGLGAGWSHGGVVYGIIEQCYSLGKIQGSHGGGITGGSTASINGHVSIVNCYSRGDISGGGICGRNTAGNSGTVNLTNVHASGQVMHSAAGGLIGRISDGAKKISITMSVYNGDMGSTMIGKNDAKDKTTEQRNSGNLSNTNVQAWVSLAFKEDYV